MIGAHPSARGGYSVRRDEHPIRRKNPSGEYVWVARYTTASGKRRSAGTFEKKGPCRQPADDGSCCAQHAIYAAYEQDRLAPTVETGEPLTVETYALRHWLRLHPRAESSDAVYTARLRAAFPVDCGDGPLGRMLFADVQRRHAVRLIDFMLRDQGRAARGVTAVLGALSAMWQDALDDDWTRTANPFLGHRIRQADSRVQRPARQPRVLSFEEMHALAAAAGPLEPMLRLMSDCGLRVGEALAVYRDDVKLGARCDEAGCAVAGPHLHVRRKAFKGAVHAGTKSGPGRVAPLAPVLAALLAAVPPRIDTPLLFPTSKGVWWESDWRRVAWKPAVERAGIGTVRPHDLRHSYVSAMRAAGIDVADAAAAAGHTVDTATRVYTHSLGRSYEAMREAVGE
jgi:integrase